MELCQGVLREKRDILRCPAANVQIPGKATSELVQIPLSGRGCNRALSRLQGEHLLAFPTPSPWGNQGATGHHQRLGHPCALLLCDKSARDGWKAVPPECLQSKEATEATGRRERKNSGSQSWERVSCNAQSHILVTTQMVEGPDAQ